MKDVVRKIHDLGKPVVLHGCGNQNYTLDMLWIVKLMVFISQPQLVMIFAKLKKSAATDFVHDRQYDISELFP